MKKILPSWLSKTRKITFHRKFFKNHTRKIIFRQITTSSARMQADRLKPVRENFKIWIFVSINERSWTRCKKLRAQNWLKNYKQFWIFRYSFKMFMYSWNSRPHCDNKLLQIEKIEIKINWVKICKIRLIVKVRI